MNNPDKISVLPLGEIRIQVVSGGRFVMDGGTMFGVVPKALWSRRAPPDENNCLRQETNCLLVETGQHRILIDTGYGSKLAEKQRTILAAEPGNPLCENLHRLGTAPEEIDLVILSHLHFDHAGGATTLDQGGRPRPTFPHAQYVVQRREWMLATAELPELEGAYQLENLLPLRDSGQLRLIDGSVEIVAQLHAILTGGHTPGHQAILIEEGNEAAVYLGDLCPSHHHLRVRWGTSYDLDVLELRRQKRELLTTIARHNWWACFDHDVDVSCARIQPDEDRDFCLKS